jgi:plasmid stabilization system protein ParE
MAKKLKIYDQALSDVQSAISYYEMQQIGLGHRFERQVQVTFNRIQKPPFAASFALNDIRYKIVPKFPFVIYYNFDSKSIYILRVFNTHQVPKF